MIRSRQNLRIHTLTITLSGLVALCVAGNASADGTGVIGQQQTGANPPPASSAPSRIISYGPVIRPHFTYSGGPGQPQRPSWQSGYGYGNGPYAGSIYPGLPLSSVTIIQPDDYGGYDFSNYSDSSCGDSTVPSVYSLYGGLPGYIVVDEGYVQDILPVSPYPEYYNNYPQQSNPGTQVNEYNYTVNNYYAAPQPNPPAPAAASDAASVAQSAAQPVNQGYNAALSEIQQAWLTGDVTLLRKHLPPSGSKIEVAIDGQDSYVIESDHFAQITQDAFNKLATFGFAFTNVAVNSDDSVTGYATHTYSPAGVTDGSRRKMYLSFTLEATGGEWMISGIDSSTTQFVGAQTAAPISLLTSPIVAVR